MIEISFIIPVYKNTVEENIQNAAQKSTLELQKKTFLKKVRPIFL